ncbi:hypothetical protein [Anditalea andensis]|uniref:Uncharacterized protein n=1 Tax=Anditalea andensis TaxID=1048983 RepID=A0A074KWZ4_9BACT|nr:hypothetical protein [Anditalea andensis]KEO74506.1 hypothetical protein EL17_07145 [Anditalea andensis]
MSKKNIYRLRWITCQIGDFNNQRTVFINQLHTLEHSAYPWKEVEINLKKLIRELGKGIGKIDSSIGQLIKEYEKLSSRLEKIKN